MIHAALVLEGGSLRSVFTNGVLDVMMEHDLKFSYVNGVSAGSMCAMSYLSNQPGRNMEVNTKYLHDRRYISLKHMLKKREIFNFDFLFGELSEKLVPFDYEAFYHSDVQFEAVATRCRTGKPEYFTKGICKDMISAVRASCSMPVLSHMVDVEGKKYLDGGISMPIAYQRAIDLGYDKIVVVLTREQGYRKKPMGKWTQRGYDRYFAPLPHLLESLNEVPARYNRMQEELDRLKASGRIMIIRPENPVTVSRVEQNRNKLEALYLEGRSICSENLEKIIPYCNS